MRALVVSIGLALGVVSCAGGPSVPESEGEGVGCLGPDCRRTDDPPPGEEVACGTALCASTDEKQADAETAACCKDPACRAVLEHNSMSLLGAAGSPCE